MQATLKISVPKFNLDIMKETSKELGILLIFSGKMLMSAEIKGYGT